LLPKCRSGEPGPDGKPVRSDDTPQPDYTVGGVRIGAFAADVTIVPRAGKDPQTGARLLLPVRGDASLTVIDFDESPTKPGSPVRVSLTCGPPSGENHYGDKCAPDWRLTGADGAGAGSRGIVLEGEPFAVATASNVKNKYDNFTGLAAVIHQSSGDVSLFINTERATNSPGTNSVNGAKLAYTLTGLAGGATAIARFDDGVTDAVRFLVANRTTPSLSVVQLFTDPTADRSGLVLTGTVPLNTQLSGIDSRGIVVDPPNPGETRPTRVFVTNRTPASIVVGQTDQFGTLTFFDNIAMPVGPSRIERTVIGGHTMLLAASYDARSVVVVDPDARRVTNVVLTHRGPYAMTVDQATGLAFVANFTDSTIQVIDINPGAEESLIFSVGRPSGPTS